MKPLNIVVEPFSFCPLKCCSCPTGRRELKLDSTMLSADQLTRILTTISLQADINRIGLFNWGEPLLHPTLHELVSVGKKYGPVYISTTGNNVRCDVNRLVESAPDKFIVATSGFSQEIYETTHANGKVSAFFEFCQLLAELGAVDVHVCYHRYHNNLHEEAQVKEFAKSLGFGFNANWACHAPVEALINGESNPYQVVSTHDALTIAGRQPEYKCGLQTSEVMLNADGSMRGCSAAADQTTIGNIFEDSLATLMQRKREYSLCDSCYTSGAYKICCGSNIGVDRECARRSPGSGIGYAIERLRKRVWHRLELRREK